MGGHNQNPSDVSLFSLEVVVERLRLHHVTCRFPAVAFRILDYPTVVIYHVENDLATAIRNQLQMLPANTLPPSIPELMNREGDYVMKKGKSCLFQTSAGALLGQLTSTPLYLMVVDTYPAVPRLVGSCTVPLDGVMRAVHEDITQQGLSVPAVHGDKGCFQVYNLMGAEIGQVTLGFRLLSLGQGILPHIPAGALMRPATEVAEPAPAETRPGHAGQSKPQGQAQTGSPDGGHIQIFPAETEKELRNACVGSTNETGTQGTQTDTKKNLRKSGNHGNLKTIPVETQDLVVGNMVCPPPLFFNSEYQGKTFEEEYVFDESVGTDTSTRDTLSDDSGAEDLQADNIQESTKCQAVSIQEQRTLNAVSKSAVSKANLEQLPILNALINEIGSLNLLRKSRTKERQVTKEPTVVEPVKAELEVSKEKVQHSAKAAQAESIQDFLHRLAQPKHMAANHMTCKAQAPPVPKEKSWLNEHPLRRPSKDTNLLYGMTKSQRLRLAAKNPTLLKTLENQELQRKQQVQQRRQKLGQAGTFKVKSAPASSKREMASAKAVEGASHKRHKKPVPTPRYRAKAGLLEELEALDDEASQGYETPPSGDDAQRPGIERESTFYGDEREQVSSADKENSSDYHSAEAYNYSSFSSEHQSEEDIMDVHQPGGDGIVGHQPDLRLPITPRTPRVGRQAFPQHWEAREDGEEGNHANQEAKATLSVEDLGLRKVVETYSDSDRSEKESQASQRSSTPKQGQQHHDHQMSLDISQVAPLRSSKSPLQSTGQRLSPVATRESLDVSSAHEEMDRSGPVRESVERSVSLKDSGRNGRGNLISKLGRKRKESFRFIRTESVSSYVPTEGSDLELEDYSDGFETISEDSAH